MSNFRFISFQDYGSFSIVEVKGFFERSERDYMKHKRFALSSDTLMNSGFQLHECRLYTEGKVQENEWYKIQTRASSLLSDAPYDDWSNIASYQQVMDELKLGLQSLIFDAQRREWFPKKHFNKGK